MKSARNKKNLFLHPNPNPHTNHSPYPNPYPYLNHNPYPKSILRKRNRVTQPVALPYCLDAYILVSISQTTAYIFNLIVYIIL